MAVWSLGAMKWWSSFFPKMLDLWRKQLKRSCFQPPHPPHPQPMQSPRLVLSLEGFSHLPTQPKSLPFSSLPFLRSFVSVPKMFYFKVLFNILLDVISGLFRGGRNTVGFRRRLRFSSAWEWSRAPSPAAAAAAAEPTLKRDPPETVGTTGCIAWHRMVEQWVNTQRVWIVVFNGVWWFW